MKIVKPGDKKNGIIERQDEFKAEGRSYIQQKYKGKAFRIQIQYENVFGKLSKSLKEKKFVGCFGSSEWCFIIDSWHGFFQLLTWTRKEKSVNSARESVFKSVKTAKFESNLLKTNKDVGPQSPKILRTFVW